MLCISGLTVAYGKKQVLRDLNLVVRPGEIVALVGPNGSGKSTLLKTVIGLLKPAAGDILFEGTSVQPLLPQQRNQLGIGVLQQGIAIFPSLSVEDNVELANDTHRRYTSATALDFAWECFPALRPLRRRRAGLLSGGERQMLAITMVLVQQPRLLLLDEPSAGLAPSLVRQIFDRLSAYRQKVGASILLVEQNIKAVSWIAEKAYSLKNGQACGIQVERFQ